MFTTVWISFLVKETTGAAEAGDEGDDEDGGRRAHHHPDQDCQAESLYIIVTFVPLNTKPGVYNNNILGPAESFSLS
jgi:hypothetical protein